MRALLPILILLVTAGCGSHPLGPRFDQRFTHFGGCGDVVFFAVDSEDEVMVTFTATGLVAAAREAEAEASTVVELPSDDVALRVEQGSRISDATCDDEDVVFTSGGADEVSLERLEWSNVSVGWFPG